MKEGRKKVKREIAKNLLAKGESMEIVSESTKLSKDEIEELMDDTTYDESVKRAKLTIGGIVTIV